MSDTQLIKDKIDIIDLIGEYVQLKPAGVNHKGLCPFHQEKSPSFMANRERQSWHCFGCAKGGDIFSFVQEIEGMEFIEALKFLANRAGVPLEAYKNEGESSQKNRIKDINTEAARFFHNVLTKLEAAKPAQDYLVGRGVLPATIDEWQIGYIPDQWELLTKYLLKKGHGIDDLVASGLTIKRDGADPGSGRGFYDRFRGRVMFPIWDVHGAVVGFTGRVLVETEHSGGKYVNTPQTVVYDKSRVVFGLNKAKQAIKGKNLIVMVEGQMDVIACHQAGMKHVVATSGTALTTEQIHLLKRYSTNLAIAFDADNAGQAAAKRGFDVALAEGMNIRIISIPSGGGKDADECLKKNPDVWFRAVEEAREYMAWRFAGVLDNKKLQEPKAKQAVANELLPDINRIPFAVERDHWLRELASEIGVEAAVLREDMGRFKEEKTVSRTAKGIEKKVAQTQTGPARPAEKTRLDLLVERFLALLIRFPMLMREPRDQALEALLSTPPYITLYESIKKRYSTGDSAPHVAPLPTDILPTIDILLMRGELDFSDFTEKDGREEYLKLMTEIPSEAKKKRRKELQLAIERAEREKNETRLQELLQEFQDV